VGKSFRFFHRFSWRDYFVERLLRGRGDEIRIADSFKKIVNDSKKPWRNEEGFVIMGMK
jgi:hypothetical protein